MLDTTRKLRVLNVDMVEDVEDNSLYLQFLNLEITTVFQTGPFLVVAKNPVFS